MSAFLVYVSGFQGPCPQVIHDTGAKPFIDEGIRGRMWPGEPRRITDGEAADLRAGAVTLDELAERYKPALGAAHG